jgi:PAS domain S-box-containing protein
MDITLLLGISVVLQFTASYLALRLILLTGEKKAWLFISCAILVMAVRRSIMLYHVVTEQMPRPHITWDDWTTLIISVLMVIGVAWIGPLFYSIKRTTEALRVSEEKYRTLFENSMDAIYICTRDGQLIDFNQATMDLMGFSREEMTGMNVMKWYAVPDDRSRFQEEIEREGAVKDYEVKFVRSDGTKIDCLLSSTAQRNDDGAVFVYRGIIRDVSSKKEAERILRESEAKFRSLAETAVIAIVIFQNGRFRYLNPACEVITGYTQEELASKEFWNVVHPDFKELVKRNGLAHQRDDEALPRYEFKIITKSGDERWLDGCGTRIEYEGQPAGLATLFDITERKRAEEERVRLVTAIEQAGEGVLITDMNGCIVYVNPAFEEAGGYDREELVGRSPCSFANPYHDRLCYHALEACLVKGEEWKGRFNNRKKDGTVYAVEASISPVRNEAGSIINCVVLERDITHETKLERQLRQAQKMEAIGTLAGGIAHDFNNILGIMLGFTQLAMFEGMPPAQQRDYLRTSLEAGQRAKELVAQILSFSRQREQGLKPTQISHIINEAMKMLRASFPSTIEIRKFIDSHGTILADPIQIHQVLMNLCANAVHAMREQGGVLEVNLVDVELDQTTAAQFRELSPGSYLKLSVSDTGHGMGPAILERIFEPYFTTKPLGEGTGLGLAVAYGIIRSHGGIITAYSEPDNGSTFHVFLPRFDNEAQKQSQERGRITTDGKGGNERILFVDDEEDLCKIGQEMLEHLGYSVVTRSSSIEALELFREQPDKFDLVITDLTMPKMTGLMLARELLAIRPEISIILCTGFGQMITTEKARAIGIHELMMKPIFVRELAETVRRLLDRQPASV